MHPMLHIAIRAARSAGNFIAKSFESNVDVTTEQKANNDYVTNIDREAEQIIISKIAQSYPEHSIIAEESGTVEGNDDFKWVIDPLDGTTNFVMGIPHFCVSIALLHRNKLDQAVVYDPLRNELFTASRGGGAQMNNRRLRVRQRKELAGTLLGTGLPYRDKTGSQLATAKMGAIHQQCGDVRSSGSAALDMAYVAAGRLDGYWETGLKPWDIAAGELLVKEAGGLVVDFGGGHSTMTSGQVVCGNPKIVQALVKVLK